jgi:D-sedoheptulose 7-phosphate isomerase
MVETGKSQNPDRVLAAVDAYLQLLTRALAQISREQIEAVIQVLYQAWKENRQVFIFGNGGSAATASHMANDLCKYTIAPGKPRLRAFALTDNVAMLTAWGNDSGYDCIFAEQLSNYLQPGDVVIAISTSGNSSNVICGLEEARGRQAVCVGFTGDNGGRLKELVDYCVFIPDEQIGRQEDGHMILDHVIATILRDLILNSE